MLKLTPAPLVRNVLPTKGPVKEGPATSTPVYQRWWFWTIIGVAVVGGTVAAILTTRGGPEVPRGTIGNVAYPLRLRLP